MKNYLLMTTKNLIKSMAIDTASAILLSPMILIFAVVSLAAYVLVAATKITATAVDKLLENITG